MWIPLLILGIWLMVVALSFANYRRIRRPVPGLAVAVYVSLALFWAVFPLLHEGTMWPRCLIAALWLLAAAGLLLVWRRSREKDIPSPYQAGLTKGPVATVDGLAERLRSLGFTVTPDVSFDGQAFSFVAQKAGFDTSRLCFVETFFMIAQFSHLDEATLPEYSKKCAKYAGCHRRISLPWLGHGALGDILSCGSSIRRE